MKQVHKPMACNFATAKWACLLVAESGRCAPRVAHALQKGSKDKLRQLLAGSFHEPNHSLGSDPCIVLLFNVLPKPRHKELVNGGLCSGCDDVFGDGV